MRNLQLFPLQLPRKFAQYENSALQSLSVMLSAAFQTTTWKRFWSFHITCLSQVEISTNTMNTTCLDLSFISNISYESLSLTLI